MTPELQLILSAAAGAPPLPPGSAQAAAAPRLDWDLVVRLAGLHGVRPLAFRYLADCLPEPHRCRLADDCSAIAAHNRFVTGELIRILDLLESAGIPVIPFKGPVLAHQLFADVGMREFSDLDMIVPREQAWDAVDVLRGAGYTPDFQPMDWRREWLLGYDCEVMLTHPAGFAVEIHWAFAPAAFPSPIQSPFDADGPAGHSTVRIMGRTMQVLGPESSLLLAAGHIARHSPPSAKLIGELAIMMRRVGPPTAPDRSVRYAVALTGLFYPDIARLSNAPAAPWLVENLRYARAAVEDPMLRRPGIGRALPFELRFISNPIGKLNYFHRIVTSPSAVDLQAHSFPGILYPLYLLAMVPRRLRKHAS